MCVCVGVCRRSYRKNEVIEENKALLKEKYSAAKALGKQVKLFPLLIVSSTLRICANTQPGHPSFMLQLAVAGDMLSCRNMLLKSYRTHNSWHFVVGAAVGMQLLLIIFIIT